jgi:hypothetical protein
MPNQRRPTFTRNTRKRGLRFLPKSGGYFVHVTSRVVQQRFLFGDPEKAQFIDLLNRWADFSGLRILTYCLMNNHVHLLLWVPPVQQVRTDEILRRIQRVWPERKVRAWVEAYQSSPALLKKEMEADLTRRMHNLPDFMRVLKQSFSAWYNKKHHLYGVFWDGRYRSMVLKDSPEALCSVAAYIDLNPMRAGICKDPGNYTWSGYGQAEKGNARCRHGLRQLIQVSNQVTPRELGVPQMTPARKPVDWTLAQNIYRAWLYAKGYSPPPSAVSKKTASRHGFTSEEVLAVFAKTIAEIKENK